MGMLRYAGVDLSTLGFTTEIVDGLWSAPAARGANLLLPYQTGRRWAQKFYDERSIIVTAKLAASSRATLQKQIDQLKALFPIGAGEQRLEAALQDGKTCYVMAEVRNILMPADATFSQLAAKVSVELVASDPFWYGSVLAGGQSAGAWTLDSGVVLDDGLHWLDNISTLFAQSLSAQKTMVACFNPGTIYNSRPVFTLTGNMLNPKITNTRNGYSVQILGAIGSVIIDCGLQSATVAGGPMPSSAVVLGAGQTDWLHLEAGNNNLLIDLGVAPAPSVAYQASFSPAYL